MSSSSLRSPNRVVGAAFVRHDLAHHRALTPPGEAASPPAPACKALGQALDEPCFRKIGTPEYDARCSGHLIVAERTDSEQVCQGQLMAARGSGLAK